ncbi:MAG TPA: hypothetical protein DDX47_04630 [Candidatus Jacksonbacteria bacterium]|nr:hypothetical protein [Candidatus Jacksonbacteria bacterium]
MKKLPLRREIINGIFGASLIIFSLLIVGVSKTQAVDTINSPGFEEKWQTENKAYDWQDFQSGYQRVPTAHTGAWGITMANNSQTQLSGAYQRIDLQQTAIKPVFIGGYVSGASVLMAPGSWLGASIYAEIHLKDGKVVYWNSLPNSGTFSWRWIGFNTGTLASVDQPIDYIYLVPLLGQATGRANFDDMCLNEFESTGPAVTIMFDDNEISTFTEGKPVLDGYQMPASVAVPTSLIGKVGFMNVKQLNELKNKNWEIVSHGIKHVDLTTLGPAALLNELSGSKLRLQNLGFPVKNFALPFGAYNANIMSLGSTLYTSIRAFELGDNPQGLFPYDVKVQAVMDTTTPEMVKTWLEQAQAKNRWLVLVFHQIGPGDDTSHTTPETFKQIMKEVKDSGLNVITYDQGIQRYAVKKEQCQTTLPTPPPVASPTQTTIITTTLSQ